MKAPSLTNLRNVLKGKTYKRGKVETRGRRRLLTFAKLRSVVLAVVVVVDAHVVLVVAVVVLLIVVIAFPRGLSPPPPF